MTKHINAMRIKRHGNMKWKNEEQDAESSTLLTKPTKPTFPFKIKLLTT